MRMDFLEIKNKIATKLTPKRYQHSLGVCETAEILAERFNVNLEQAKIAGILHDCAREFTLEGLISYADLYKVELSELEKNHPILLHSYIGAMIAEAEYNITDQEILRAIRLHTTGGINMSKLDKIIYLADAIEVGRCYPGVEEIRECSQVDLDQAVLLTIDKSIQYVKKRRNILHPDTIIARNELILKAK
mgnify:FL=1